MLLVLVLLLLLLLTRIITMNQLVCYYYNYYRNMFRPGPRKEESASSQGPETAPIQQALTRRAASSDCHIDVRNQPAAFARKAGECTASKALYLGPGSLSFGTESLHKSLTMPIWWPTMPKKRLEQTVEASIQVRACVHRRGRPKSRSAFLRARQS